MLEEKLKRYTTSDIQKQGWFLHTANSAKETVL